MQTITTQQLKSMQQNDEDLVLINTLPKDKFSQTKIPGAQNFPQDAPDFAVQVENASGDKDAKVVVYCGSEECDSSSKGATKLEKAGFTNVCVYKAGAKGWQQESADEPQTTGRR